MEVELADMAVAMETAAGAVVAMAVVAMAAAGAGASRAIAIECVTAIPCTASAGVLMFTRAILPG